MKSKLSNPAVIAAIASSPQGQKAIGNSLQKVSGASVESLTIVKNVFLIGIFGFLGYKGYRKFFDNFSKISQNTKYKPATITDATAFSKAESIYRAMYGAGNGYNSVKNNLINVGFNDFIKIYNAFGGRESAIPLSPKKNLIEWINDEFSGQDLINLRFIRPLFF